MCCRAQTGLSGAWVLTFNPSIWETEQEDPCEFKAVLVYIATSRPPSYISETVSKGMTEKERQRQNGNVREGGREEQREGDKIFEGVEGRQGGFGRN